MLESSRPRFNVIGVLIRTQSREDKRQRENTVMMKTDWSDAASSQRMPKMTGKPLASGKRRGRILPRSSGAWALLTP